MRRSNVAKRFGAALGFAIMLLSAVCVLPARAYAATPSVSYHTHVQDYGWEKTWAKNGAQSGTTGQAKRLEAINIKVDGAGVSGGITYQVHCQDIGWMGEVQNGAQAGTTGQAKRLEAIKIHLTGDLAKRYNVEYRVHCQDIGWMGWVQNGALAGTTGRAKRLEAIQIRLVEKEDLSKLAGAVNYISHAQDYGWLNWMSDGGESGTTGQAKRLEAIRISVNASKLGATGGVKYRVHCQDYGWMDWVEDGGIAGTTGQAKRLEAIEIQLTGNLASAYDVYYQTHVENGGWMGWAKNGATSGSTGQGLRMEAIRVVLVPKGDPAPGTDVGYVYVPETNVPIMGKSQATQADVVKHFKSVNSNYPSSVYTSKGAATIEDFVKILFDEANAEGVRPDVVYAQAMLETNYLRFGGDVKAEQCNFAGIGATGGGVAGNSFPDVATGLRAQVQHLKAYASTAPLNKECVDPRFSYVSRGVAPTLGALSTRWATGSDYGKNINRILTAVDELS